VTPPLHRPVSLVWSLSRWLVVQSLLGLALVCTGVYLATAWSLVARQDETIEQQRRVIEHLLDEAIDDEGLAALGHKLDDFFVGISDVDLRLRLPGGGLLYEHRSDFQTPQSRRERFEHAWKAAPGTIVQAELVLDTRADEQLLRRLALTLLVSALAGAVLVSVAGSLVVRRGLMPVLALSRRIGSLQPGKVHLRLDGADQPQELQPVVEQFNALLERLEKAYAQLEAFNADVAHELRTPLAVLIGQSEVALSRPRSVHELQDVIGANLEYLQRLSAIVNDMLFLSRADRGARARRAFVPSLADTAREVIEYHEAALHEAGQGVRVRGDAAGPFDAALLRRALSNLLSNARRYAARGSLIEVDIGMLPDGRLQLVVSNPGPAIDAQHLPRLFDRFYRADAAREHSDTNHGLGLAIVAAIARMHGGEPFAESASQRTRVGLRLPAVDP
jgi:two-component system heavy metal sensor histidine kinase CusS